MDAAQEIECRPNGHATARILRFGRERGTAVVIDDFLADAQSLVEFAATRGQFRPVGGNLYPGVRSPLPDSYLRVVVGCLLEPVAKIFGLSDIDVAQLQGDFSVVTTPPERLQLLQCLPHFDTTNLGQIAVLHYLCTPEQGGTAFYRHRTTGYESITAERHDRYMAVLGAELKAGGPPERYYIQGDTPVFERIGTLEAAFNRLVIYRSATLHSGNIPRGFPFDPDPRTGRLTANTFLVFRRGVDSPR
jgi:hypothetical protein